MDLKSFLQWEVPSSTQAVDKTPAIWLARKQKEKGGYDNYRLIFNQAFIKDAHPELLEQERGKAVSYAAINLDRLNKTVNIVFGPPDDVPRYKIRNSYQASYATHLANKMLLSDIWEDLFKFPPTVDKQFLKFSKGEEVAGYQIWRLKYDPKEDRNSQIIANTKKRVK